ncbi:lyase family protein [Algicella marina]|uniref:3-carboxy-cis,cis-muconate cycloisomerase n=1 Tax=Algicella marina TaxID=2683284 RepID=A0A6P1T1U2_9RHOB|nr:lyase family protein [Algicella marina]QHQ34502.1 3-carboxy-cis,cis-muconate cycloisomerase [Algicella marina]
MSAYAHPLLTDPEVATLFSEERLIAECIAFEIALTKALAATGRAESADAEAALAALASFKPDIAALRESTRDDGLLVPGLTRQIKTHIGPDAARAFHTGATSQDLLDTATARILRDLSSLFAPRLAAILEALAALEARHGSRPLMARTRLQAALPITVADRIATWRAPLIEAGNRLTTVTAATAILQFGGPVGTRDDPDLATAMADSLGLAVPERPRHTDRSHLADYAHWLSRLATALGKIGLDTALMAQQGIGEVRLSGGGTSSAMPHKQNPVRAETLVTLARWTATMLPTMTGIHEMERSGIAWAGEWLALPQMAESTGAALLAAEELLGQIEDFGSPA